MRLTDAYAEEQHPRGEHGHWVEGVEALQALVGARETARLLRSRRGKELGLSNVDIAHIGAYTLAGQRSIYQELNRQLRSGSSSKLHATFAEGLSNALQKLPSFKGKVYRNAWLSTRLFNKLKAGRVFVEKGFTSGTTSQKLATAFSNKQVSEQSEAQSREVKLPVTLVIKSQTGKDISHVSQLRREKEIIFDKGTRFKVTKVDRKWLGIDIYLTEKGSTKDAEFEVDADWQEEQHPRGAGGKWESGSAVQAYLNTESPHHAVHINQALRSGKLSDEQKHVVQALDKAIAASPPFNAARVVYRGTAAELHYKAETILSNPGFTSTTTDRNTALAYAEAQKKGVLYEITCPAGTRALDTRSFDKYFQGGEKELLLPRGARFIVDRSRNEAGIKIVQARYIGSWVHPEHRYTDAFEEEQHPRGEHGKWAASGQAVPGSLKGINESRMSLAAHRALRVAIQEHYVNAIRNALPEGTELRVGKWTFSGGFAGLDVGISVKGDRSSSGWSRVGVDRAGNVYLQQHDIDLASTLQGKGIGGKIVTALSAGYKALGAGRGDVPIHVNTNPSFWARMNQKLGGVFAHDADWSEESHPRGGGGKFTFGRGDRVEIKKGPLKGQVGRVTSSIRKSMAETPRHFVRFDTPVGGMVGATFHPHELRLEKQKEHPTEVELMKAKLRGDGYVYDAAPRSVDPTRTTMLRRGFRAAAQLNLNQLRANLRKAIVEFNTLDLPGGAVVHFASPADRLRQFANWIEVAAFAQLDAKWWVAPWIDKAITSGLLRARREVDIDNRSPLSLYHDTFASLHQLARQEMDGIVAALVQQVSRTAHSAVMRQLSTTQAYRQIVKPIDGSIKHRLRAFANTMVVKAHNVAKIETYRQKGITHVGIVPELMKHGHRDSLTRDQDEDDLVEWITAEDDDVCFRCEDMAEGSPYTNDEVEDLIPLHPNCRCAVTPWFSYGDAVSVHDVFEEELHPHLARRVATWRDAEFDPEEHPHAPAGAAEGGQFIATGGKKPKFKSSASLDEHVTRVNKILQNPVPKNTGFVAYRAEIRGLISESKSFSQGYVQNSALKKKIGESFDRQAQIYAKKGQLLKAETLSAKAKKFGWTAATTAPVSVAPVAKPTPPAPPPPSAPVTAAPKPPAIELKPSAKATMQELQTAQKTTAIPKTGYEEADKVIAEFNAKYQGKTLTTQEELEQKVIEYKILKGETEWWVAAGKAKKEKAAAEKAAKEAEELIGTSPEAKEHFEALTAIMGSGGVSKDYLDAAKKKLASTGFDKYLAPVEAALIMAYTGSKYVEVNKQLRIGQISEKQYGFAKGLSDALAKLPPYTGTVWRKASVDDEQAKKYQPGFIVPERAFTSSASAPGIWHGSYHYEIESKNGRDIARLSNHPGEKEVLFDMNSHFRVVKREGYKIYMKEV